MSSFRKVIPALAVIFFLIHSNGFAQQFDEVMSSEALRPFWSVYGFGASAFTLLNNSQLATDISSTQYNPAFLTNIKRPKASITGKSFSVKQLSTLADVGKEYSASSSESYIDYIGFAYPLPVYQGSFVLSASYTPAAYYYSSATSKGITGTTFYDEDDNPFIVDTDLEYNVRETGSIDVVRVAGATEFMKNVNMGMSLNFYSGERNYQATETSTDVHNLIGDSSIVYNQNIKPSYSGVNADFGLCFQSDNYKLGLRISAPLNLSIREVRERTQEYTDDEDTLTTYLDTYDFKYKSRYPLEIGSNFAIKIAKITLGMDIVFHNWQKIEVDLLEDETAINRDLYWNLRNTTDISASIAIPFGNSLSTRFAYRRVQSPYADLKDSDEEYYHVIGANVETILNRSLIIGCSYQRGFGNLSNYYPYFETTTKQKYTEDRLALSLAVLF
ncbi:MAG: hypothetical protein COT43_07120 [Candidatus Marinimicrobia bacterium CG08_land_8_20_14_0_20_45_22]|nr:MAG: hypothetical protein COT43_07120 [Candidatus Marinimicrobia bacterium CG08_land_8_20_14_0_20_45_22]